MKMTTVPQFPEGKHPPIGARPRRLSVAAVLLLVFCFPARAPAQQAAPVAQPAGKQAAAQGQGAQAPNQAGQNAAKNPAAPIKLTTIEDKEYSGPAADLVKGVVTLKAEALQAVALDELLKINYTHDTKLAIEWVGQVNRDFVQVGAVEGGNSIRDVQLHVTGLRHQPIKQLAIVCRSPVRVWRLDVKQSPAWRINIDRVSESTVAEVFFEPPTEDLFEKELEITVTYNEGAPGSAKVKATGHTSDQTKLEEVAEGSAAPANRRVVVNLQGDDLIKGQLLKGSEEQISVETPWRPVVEVPSVQVRGILYDGAKPETKTRYEQLLAKPGEQDVALISAKDGSLAEIAGSVKQFDESTLKVIFEGKERSIKMERVQGLVLAAHPSTRTWKGAFQVFRLATGDRLSANWLGQGEKMHDVRVAWGNLLELPRDMVVEIMGRNGKMVNLGDLSPAVVEQVPYFDRLMPYVRDKSWNDRPLKVDGKTYTRGLTLHAKCVLIYELDGQFATFRSVVGFEDEAGTLGRVVCRVTADDKELFAKPDLRATEKPQPIEVSIAGAKQLKLEVDFGEDEDVGDRVIFANARIYRE